MEGKLPDAAALAAAAVPVPPEREPFDWDAWVAEREQQGTALMQQGRRDWAAMTGWDRVKTPEAWDALKAETAADWESGHTLLTLLGGARYIEPERAALCLLLWRQFLTEHRPDGPSEYLLIAMAVVSFDHFCRVNRLVHNLEARVETEFFSTKPLAVADHLPNVTGRTRNRNGRLWVEEIAAHLGGEALPWLDRTNRMVIRNLRALREIKGASAPLTVANYGQLNVGQAQSNTAALPSAGATGVPMRASAKEAKHAVQSRRDAKRGSESRVRAAASPNKRGSADAE